MTSGTPGRGLTFPCWTRVPRRREGLMCVCVSAHVSVWACPCSCVLSVWMSACVHAVCLCHCCSVAQMCPTPWTAARQASLSITNSRSLLTLTSMESVMPSSCLILCRPLLLLPSRVFVYVSDMRVCLGGGPGCMKS